MMEIEVNYSTVSRYIYTECSTATTHCSFNLDAEGARDLAARLVAAADEMDATLVKWAARRKP